MTTIGILSPFHSAQENERQSINNNNKRTSDRDKQSVIMGTISLLEVRKEVKEK